MKSFRILFLIAFLCSFSVVIAQLSTNEQPISFGETFRLTDNKSNAVQVITMPELDMNKIEAEDRQDEEDDIPPRFGYRHKVNYDLMNFGTWQELTNGDKLWRLNVVCPGALSVNFCFDKFWIPEGGKFFVYSKDKKHSIGAFTSRNNKGDRENVRGFATGLVYGSEVVLEYYQPKEITTDAIISIEYIVHGYRYISIAKGNLDCMVNVNCSEGQNWQNEKNAVALMILEGERCCTGSLINTTDLSHKPYFLTAEHCVRPADSANSPYLDDYVFYWNYEEPGCESSYFVRYYTTSGAIVVANYRAIDSELLKLSEDPKNLSNYTPYYLGWDCSGQSGDPGVCIHHPNGDFKKISTVATQPVAGIATWTVHWRATENGHGTTDDGSSGSPLLTSEHKVIGHLGYGNSNCNNLGGESTFRRFDVSWTGYDNDSIHRKMSCWLDSLGTGEQAIEGLQVISSTVTKTSNDSIFSNIRITGSGQLTIQGNMAMLGNSRVVVDGGGVLIIDGGILSGVDVVLNNGAFLRIINGGILRTRNGFTAPLGTTVEIFNGEIQ